jgi:hypothetical protein
MVEVNTKKAIEDNINMMKSNYKIDPDDPDAELTDDESIYTLMFYFKELCPLLDGYETYVVNVIVNLLANHISYVHNIFGVYRAKKLCHTIKEVMDDQLEEMEDSDNSGIMYPISVVHNLLSIKKCNDDPPESTNVEKFVELLQKAYKEMYNNDDNNTSIDEFIV